MPVDELDRLVCSGLRAEVDAVAVPSPSTLADHLAVRRRRRTRRRQQFGAGLATVVVAAVVAVVAVLPGTGRTGVETGPAPFADEGSSPPAPVLGSGFGAPTGSAGRVAGSVAPLDLSTIGNGWHEIDTSPIPALDPSSVVWSGEELFVVDTAEGGVWGYRPLEGTWRQYAAPPAALAGDVTLVLTADRVVAVSDGGPIVRQGVTWTGHAAALDPATDSWTDLGAVPLHPTLQQLSTPGPRSGSDLALVWTGAHLLDLTHGRALDAATGRWAPIALPPDTSRFATVLYGRPMFTGTEVRVVVWAPSESLAWSPDGSSVEAIPGTPPELLEGNAVGFQAIGVGRSEAYLVTQPMAGDQGPAAAYDATTGTWRPLPPLPGLRRTNGCPGRSALVGIRFLVEPCDGDDPRLLSKDGWVPLQTGYPDTARAGRWFGTEVALWAWDGPDDGSVGPSGQSVVIWVPPTG